MSEQQLSKIPVLLLDTNVWLDFYDNTRTNHLEAVALISLVNNGNVTLTYAPTTIKDVFYLMNLRAKQKFLDTGKVLTEFNALVCRETAWTCVDHMTEIAVSLSQGEFQVQIARSLKSVHSDFEDNLILALLQTDAVDYFVTSDVKLREKSPKGAFSPADMVAYLDAI